VSATDNYAIGLHGGVTVGSKGLVYAKLGYADNGDIYRIAFQRRHAGVALGARF